MPRNPLSIQAGFSDALWDVLDPARAWIEEQAGPFEPALILLMGSAAYGEAAGVAFEEDGRRRYLPLSDLDVGIFARRMGTVDEREAFRRALRVAIEPYAERAGLTAYPIDAGFISLSDLPRMPMTLEICEIARRPFVLAGNPAVLGDWIKSEPAPFESVRLLVNRVAELMRARLARPGRPEQPAREQWARLPQPGDWREAHQAGKLVLDASKAYLALHGTLEGSIRRRLEAVDGPLCQRAVSDAEAQLSATRAEALLSTMRAWGLWRVEPAWPPPGADGRILAPLAERILIEGAQVCGVRAFAFDDVRSWRALLGSEGGPWRERARRWTRMVRQRPPGCSLPCALQLVRGWGPGCWPATLGGFLLCLYWTETYMRAGLDPGGRPSLWTEVLRGSPSDVGAALRHFLPACSNDCGQHHGFADPILGRLIDLVQWIDTAGA